MPRYFFDLDDGEFHSDDTGTECTDADAARRAVAQTLPEIARFAIPVGCANKAFTMSVRNESGATIYSATLTFAG